jgi:elongation factor G
MKSERCPCSFFLNGIQCSKGIRIRYFGRNDNILTVYKNQTFNSSPYSTIHSKKDADFKQRISVRTKEVKQKAMQKETANNNVRLDCQNIRNVGIIAHIDAGKTTTTERILYYSGYSDHLGTVDDGDTITDYMPQEQDRGITITSAAITFPWKNSRINLIDTPGHVDFTVEVERCVRVLDGAVAVFDAVTGVEAQTKTVWKQAKRYSVPRSAFMNKMDKMGAEFEAAMSTIKDKLNTQPIAIQYPVGESDGFRAIVDLVTMQVLTFDPSDRGKTVHSIDIESSNLTSDIKVEAMAKRSRMIELIAEHDDTFADFYLELGEDGVTVEQIKAAIRRFTLKDSAVAVLCGSSLRNMGVQPLMDAIIDYLPSPLERDPPIATRKNKKEETQFSIQPNADGSLCALAFKVLNDPHLGPLVFVRVYSGEITAKTEIFNSTTDTVEIPTRVFQMHANIPQDISCISTGNIGVIVGMKNTRTGDTLLSVKNKASPFELERINIPKPVFFCSIEPENSAGQAILDKALEDLQREDPSFVVTTDPETAQTLISGMGELHLEIIKDRLEKDFNVKFYTGPVMISYKETLALERPVIHRYDFERVKGETYQVILQVSANTRGKGNQFRMILNSSMCEPGPDIIHTLKDGVQEGVQNAIMRGALGYAMEDLDVVMLGATLPAQYAHKRFHQQNNDVMKLASEKCMRDLFAKCSADSNLALLEPIMSLEIQVDKQYLGTVLSDISGARRGKVKSIGIGRGALGEQIIYAEIPLSELIGYAKYLRSTTRGLGHYTMQFEKYEMMNKEHQAKKLIEIRGY